MVDFVTRVLICLRRLSIPRVALLWIAAVLVCAPLFVQGWAMEPEIYEGKAEIRRITARDYRGNPENYLVVEGPDGLAYSLTKEGIYQFSSSGSRQIFKGNYNFGAFDKDGDLWISGFRLFGRLSQGSSGEWVFEDLYQVISPLDTDGFLINSIRFKDGFVYLASLRQVIRFNPTERKSELVFKSPFISRFYEVGNQLVPIGSGSTITYLEGNQLIEVPDSNRFFGDLTPVETGQLSNGNIAILTKNGSIWIYDGKTVKPGPFAKYTGRPEFEVSWITQSPNGEILIGTKGNGLWVVSDSQCWSLGKDQGMVNNIVNSVTSFSDGTVWVAHNNGISFLVFPQNSWCFSEDNGIQGNISDVCLNKNKAYILTSIGCYQVDLTGLEQSNTARLKFEHIPFSGTRTAAVFQGETLIGTSNGLMVEQSDGWNQLGSGDCSVVLPSSKYQNRVYFGGYNGLYYVEKNETGGWNVPVKILDRNNVVHGLGEDKNGSIWIRIGFGKIGRMSPPAVITDPWLMEELGESAGVSDIWVNPLIVEGRCYIYSDALKVFDENQRKFVDQQEWWYFGGDGTHSFTQEVWSPEKGYYAAYSDLIGNLKPKPEGDYPEALRFFCGDIEDRAYCYRERGSLRLIGFGGGVIFQRRDIAIRKETKALKVFLSITENTRENETIISGYSGSSSRIDERLELSPTIRDLRFNFTTNRFFLGEETRFNFYLKGYEQANDNWVESVSKDYTNLRPGKYTFILNASDYRQERANPLEFSFRIRSPWFQTPIAYVLYAFAVAASVLFAIRFREQRLRQRNLWLSRVIEARTQEIQHQTNELIAKNDRLEEALEVARKLSDESRAASIAKGRFLASMSHEIRTPMNGVIGMCSLLEDTLLNDQQINFLETIKQSGEHLLTILNDILDFSKIEAGKLQLQQSSFSVRSVAESVVSLLAPLSKEKGIELTLYVNPKIRRNRIGDPARLRQVFLNLLGNAIKFTDQGFVRIRINPIESPEQVDWLRIEFEDSGIGIPFDKQDQLFAPFSQVDDSSLRRFGGTGLGLSISKNLTEMMGGEMFVFSLPGKGTIFGLEIPFMEDLDSQLQETLADFSDNLIWIVSKDDARSRILDSYLTDRKAKVIILSSESALNEALRNNSQTPDLLILDRAVNFPSPSLEASITSRFPNLTFLSLENEIREKRQNPKYVQLIKPFPYEQLIQVCQRALQKSETTHSNAHSSRHPLIFDGNDIEAVRILLVEDNQVNQKVAKLMLKKFGWEVDIVSDGKQATEAVSNKDYDLILMDIQMPVMDGIEATRWIREHIEPAKQPKIIAMTAGVTQLDRESTSSVGMDGFIEKPVQPNHLYQEISKVIRI